MPLRLLVAGLCAFAGLVLNAADSPAVPAAVENSVVKIFATQRMPDLARPWTKSAPREISGSGVVIEGRRILTNAHVVSYASQIQVQGNQSGEKIPATVEAIAPGIDLAVLKLEDESFFEARPPLARAQALPSIKDSVMAYGYPAGGTSLSITKGIVSRIDFAPYNFPVSGLRIQIDAAINSGNSGGPALCNDQMIGIAFSRLGGGDNIGYIIPNEEIELFLADVADGVYDGKPATFEQLQPLQNPALRAFAKVPRGSAGILVTEPDSQAASYPLQRWDVITHIGETPVDDEGMVKLDGNLRVRFSYLVQHREKNGRVPLRILRGGEPRTIDLPVARKRPMLLPLLEGAYPPYFIYGPLVFSTPTAEILGSSSANALQAYSAMGRSGSPLITRRHERPAFEGEQLVTVSSPLLSHKLGRGYGNPALRVVDSVNGVKLKNLAHLVEVLRDTTDEFVVVRFSALEADAIVLPRAEAVAATDEILSDNGIRAQGSAELLRIWSARP